MTFSDEQILAALAAQTKYNPTGASAIDVLTALGLYGEVNDALWRLYQGGKLIQTSPGNYLPNEAVS